MNQLCALSLSFLTDPFKGVGVDGSLLLSRGVYVDTIVLIATRSLPTENQDGK